MADVPLSLGALIVAQYGKLKITDNIVAILGITAILTASVIFNPFGQSDLFALVISGMTAISALAGYEIGKRQS